MAPKKKAPKKAPNKRVRKAKPKAVVQIAPPEEIDGLRPMTARDYQFCLAYVQTGKQVEAYRQIEPEAKDPHVGAHRMMLRPEIREHIRAIMREVSRERERAVKISARSALLTLEVADDRLMELMGQRRRNLGEVLSKDLRTPMYGDIAPSAAEDDEADDAGEIKAGVGEAFKAKLQGPAFIEDGDLLKAIDLTYKRKGGILKADKPAPQTNVAVMLYKPGWFAKKTDEGDDQ